MQFYQYMAMPGVQAGAMSDYLIPDSETLPEPDKDTADDYTSVDQLPELSANPGASDLPRLASIAPKVPDILKQPPAAVESGLSQGFLRVHIYRFSLHVPRPHPDDHKELSQVGINLHCLLPWARQPNGPCCMLLWWHLSTCKKKTDCSWRLLMSYAQHQEHFACRSC